MKDITPEYNIVYTSNIINTLGEDNIHYKLFQAVSGGNVDTLKQLEADDEDLCRLDRDKKSLLHVAVQYGRANMVDYLLTLPNMDANACDKNGWSILHEAALRGYLGIVTTLIAAKADINCRDTALNRSVLYAAIHGREIEELNPKDGTLADTEEQLQTIKYLIDNGADLNASNKCQTTILHVAAMAGFSDVARLLIDAKVDINARRVTGESALYWSTFYGHYDVSQMLINAGADLQVRNKHGHTLLHTTTVGGNVDIARLLFESIDCNACDAEGFSVIHSAAKHGHFEIFKMLMDKGADIHISAKLGWTVLHFAAYGGNVDIVKELLGLIDHNLCTTSESTALHIAAFCGHYEAFQLIVDAGADIQVRKKSGNTLLHYAAMGGNVKIAKLLIDSIDCNSCNETGNSVVYTAAAAGHLEVFKLLIDAGANIQTRSEDEDSILHGAVDGGNIDIVRILMDSFDCNASNARGKTPLHIASIEGHTDIVKILIDAGADVNRRTANFCKPVLHYAVEGGHLDIIRILRDHGANIYARDLAGNNLLHVAVSLGHIDILTMFGSLLDINVCDILGRTPFYTAVAIGRRDIMKVLLDMDANVHTCSVYGNNALHISTHADAATTKMLLDLGVFDVDARNDAGRTAVCKFAYEGSTEQIQLMIDANANCEIRDHCTWIPIYAAVSFGHLDAVRLLLSVTEDINSCDDYGRSLVHAAAAAGHVDVVRLLLDANADVNLCAGHGRMPLNAAIFHEHYDIAKLLIERGALIPKGVQGYRIFKLIMEKNAVEVMKCIIDARRNVPFAQEWEYSALAIAAEYQNEEMLEELLKYGVAYPPNNDPRRRYILRYSLVCKNTYITNLLDSSIISRICR